MTKTATTSYAPSPNGRGGLSGAWPSVRASPGISNTFTRHCRKICATKTCALCKNTAWNTRRSSLRCGCGGGKRPRRILQVVQEGEEEADTDDADKQVRE